jgi:hypothetical protein
MSRFQVSLKRREEVAAGTFASRSTSAATRSRSFGQAVDMFLVNRRIPIRAGTSTRSRSPAPRGGHDQIATRIRESVWKKNLLEMPPGGKVEIEGPWGEFVLPKEVGDVVMLAGGIGVTPFRAIVEDASARSLPRPRAHPQ